MVDKAIDPSKYGGFEITKSSSEVDPSKYGGFEIKSDLTPPPGGIPQAGPTINPKSLIPRKEDIPELAATTAMGLLTASRKTPVASVLGGAAAMGGEIIKQGGQVLGKFEGEPPKTFSEAGMRNLKAFGRGLGGEILGRGVQYGVGKALAPLSKKADYLLGIEKELGTELPLSKITDSKAASVLERSAEYTPFGGWITKQKENMLKGFKNYSERVGESIAEKRPPEITGNLAKESLQGFRDNFKQVKNSLYASFPEEVKKIEITDDELSPIINKMKEMVERKGENNPEGVSMLKRWIKRLEGEQYQSKIGKGVKTKELPTQTFKTEIDPLTRQPVEYLGVEKMPTVTGVQTGGGQLKSAPSVLEGEFKYKGSIKDINGLNEFKKEVGAATDWRKPTTGMDEEIKGLYGQIEEVLDNKVKSVDENAYNILKEANATYAEGINTIKSNLFKGIANAKPENMHKVLIQPKGVETLRMAKELLTEEDINYAARNWFDDLVKQSTRGREGEIVVDSKMLFEKLNRYDDSVVEELFKSNPEALANVKKLKEISLFLTRGKAVEGGSQTAFVNQSILPLILSTVGSIIQGGQVGGALVGLTAGLGLQGAISGATKLTRESLIKGFPNVAKIAVPFLSRTTQLGTQRGLQYMEKK